MAELAKVSNAAPATQEKASPLLDQIVDEGRFTRDPERGRDLVKEFVDQVVQGHMALSKDTETTINARIAQIDKLISAQLNEVLHHPAFQKLEGTWRGLKYLMDQSETNENLKIKILNARKSEILKDVQRASEFDQSALFKKVYEEEFGVFGGAPFAALVGDYEFGPGPEDMELLEKIAQVAASAHAPFLSAASAEMFNIQDYTKIGSHRDIGKVFDNTTYAKWKSFRQSEDSRYVGLALPHVLMRLPYGAATKQVEAFNYEEGVDGTDHSKYLWGNAAYALGARLTNAFARYGWCAAIRGVEGGGLVEGLPAHTFQTDDGDYAVKCPTELAITDRRENELSGLGFIPLCHYKGTTNAVFMATQSVNQPTKYLDADANANARLSSQLQYTFAIARFAHFLKAMMRDKVGSFMSREQCQKFLNEWIQHYVLLDDFASQDAKAKFPLRDAQIEVTEDPAKPGVYKAVARLRPHFQLDEITVSLRLVARLPQPKG